MIDQAQSLRRLMMNGGKQEALLETKQAVKEQHSTRIITVASGKGGVGKSNFTLNFAIMLAEAGYRTLIFDADIGMANIDVLIGATSNVSLYHVLNGSKQLEEIVKIGPKGIHYIPGGSGFESLFNLPQGALENFLAQLEGWTARYDVILFDTGAGLSKETMRFVTAADEIFVVTTPEPTAITDAYALIKVVYGAEPNTQFKLIVNRASDLDEGEQTAERLTSVAKRFLQLDIPVLGYIYDDSHVMKAVKHQTPFSILYPNHKVTSQIRHLVKVYMRDHEVMNDTKGIRNFIRKWMKGWK